MNKKKIKELRTIFEINKGFLPTDRDSGSYKKEWRKFKKEYRDDKA
jgi:hypothetical protein